MSHFSPKLFPSLIPCKDTEVRFGFSNAFISSSFRSYLLRVAPVGTDWNERHTASTINIFADAMKCIF